MLGTVTIEDMKRGSHIHLPFGEGDMDVPGVLARAASEIGFQQAGLRGAVAREPPGRHDDPRRALAACAPP